MQKKIILWQSYFCSIGGVETVVYNWCIQLRNYYDILVLYHDGDYKQIKRLKKYVRVEKLDKDKVYEADIAIRNSVWIAPLPANILAPRIIEMKHANYKYLLEMGKLDQQYVKDDRVTEHLACGKFVAEMYKEVTGLEIPYIQNILAPKVKTEKVLRFVTCSRIYDEAKGWKRMMRMCEMLHEAKIKFEWIVFSQLPPGIETQGIPYKEVHVYEPNFDIFDYVVDADYVVLLSDSEGLPLQILEGLQYGTPAIVTDVGGCTELIQDGVNGYVVPLDMNFDITRIKKIPKLKAYKGTTADDWCEYLGDAEYKEKPLLKYNSVKIESTGDYYDTLLNKQIHLGDIYEVDEDRAEQIIKADLARMVV